MKEFKDLLSAVRENRRLSEWIKEQNPSTYIHELISEAEELKQGIENNDVANIREELGDVMWDTLTLMLIAEDKYGFKPEQVMTDIVNKMRGRKPQIFEGRRVSKEEERKIWFEAKSKEKGREILEGNLI